jgi:hypothetical protein
MEADVEGVIGAARYERPGERTAWRNRYRERTFDTRLGPLNLKILKLWTGSYLPPFPEARKTAERALVSVLQEARIAGAVRKPVRHDGRLGEGSLPSSRQTHHSAGTNVPSPRSAEDDRVFMKVPIYFNIDETLSLVTRSMPA